VNVPEYINPLAWTGRKPGWIPPSRVAKASRMPVTSEDAMMHLLKIIAKREHFSLIATEN
jgi:hypothetical protein